LHFTRRLRKSGWKEERELEGMESSIEAAEAEVARFEQLFAAPDFYQKHGHDWQELETKLKATREEVQRLYARWEELEGLKAASVG
jgi:ATP-binding cassette subfamily F protein uup